MARCTQVLKRMAVELVTGWRAVEHTRRLCARLDVELMRGERMLSRFTR
jgi:hypothetical protein